MMIRAKARQALILSLGIAWGLPGLAQEPAAGTPQKSGAVQSAQANVQSESRVSAEMVKGKLNPATSKPGDEVAVRLNEDVKSNGEVVLKRGSTVRGVVKKVQRTENKAAAKGNTSAQSMMELQWFTPAVSGAASQQLNLALQSVVYTNPLYTQPQESGGDAFPAARSAAPARSSASGGLVSGVGGVVGGTVSSVGTAGAGVAGTQSAASSGVLAQAGSGVAAPAVLPANAQTAASLQNNFGVSGDRLFQVGSGQAISSSGSVSSMDIFSHMSNDTVITSPSRDFEISSGAQMQLLVQTQRK
jgi:hypothetical protein